MKKKSRITLLLPGTLAALLFSAALGTITYYGFTATPPQQSNTAAARHLGKAGAFNGFLADRPGEYTCDRTWGVVERAAYKTEVGAATATLTAEQEEQSPQDPVAAQDEQSDKQLRLSQAETPHGLNIISGGQSRFQQVAMREEGRYELPVTSAGGAGAGGGIGAPVGSSPSGKNTGTSGNNGSGTSGGGGKNLLVPDNKNAGSGDGSGGKPGSNTGNQGGNQGNSNGQGNNGQGNNGQGNNGQGNNNQGNNGGNNQGGNNASVPEPDMLVLLISGAIGLWLVRRRVVARQLVRGRHSTEQR